ncbi:N-acetylmuramoyl-L-alanine amidase [Salinimicrobium gaetbulicola]|uniref:N-acetylmuramoyl-L-alanine amidase n=1 Tax=Salinimicrobium gaetbulicola TaxID=999702 RepID=A0ABW3IGV4_9FLAO
MNFKCLFWIGALLLTLQTSCSINPYSKTNRKHLRQSSQLAKSLKKFPPDHDDDSLINYGPYPVGTTNFSLRKPNYVILHHTAQKDVEQTLYTFTLPRTAVSSHYVISREGEVFQMLNDHYRAWHAGAGKWGNDTDLNSASIGIELDNNGNEPFSEPQISELIDLLKILKSRYDIPTANFIGHSDIAPTRKVDPNITFPWKRLAEEGFGYWYDEIEVNPKIVGDSISPQEFDYSRNMVLKVTGNQILENGSSRDSLTININPKIALRIIGYDTSDLDAAIRAFKLHFIQKDVNAVLTEEDLKILFNLSQKYL